MMTFKNNPLKVIAIIAIVAITAFAFKPSENNSENDSETVMIKMLDTQKILKWKPSIKIYKGDGQIEKIDIKEWKGFIQGREMMDENYDALLSIVNEYKSKGYSLISHNEIIYEDMPAILNTFVLSKN
ncbi:MAG: hypothetical protein ABR595_06590 [Psychroflexus sp.]